MEKIFKGMMDVLVEAQVENDKKFYELEEKRLPFEQSEKEREERMRKEQRELQLKLFGMMAHSSMGGYGWSSANQKYDYGTSSYTCISMIMEQVAIPTKTRLSGQYQ